MGVGLKNSRVEQQTTKTLHASDSLSKNTAPTEKKNWTLHVRESNPGRLRDRQKCYQLHQHGPVIKDTTEALASPFVYQPVHGRHTTQKHSTHHSVTPRWIYRIPSELRSQASLGPISTAVGDHAGILGAECFYLIFFFFELDNIFFDWTNFFELDNFFLF